MSDFSLSFDPQALKEIVAFAGFPILMSQEVQAAMQEAGALLVESARNNMHWQNPIGALESSMQVMVDSPYEIEVGSNLPYARRREFGFSGMVDRLGRFYPHDPGAFYMEAAAYETHDQVLMLIDAAVERALSRIGGQ